MITKRLKNIESTENLLNTSLNKFKYKKYLGMGAQGRVYELCYKNKCAAQKDFNNPLFFKNEFNIYEHVNGFILDNHSPHFPYFYGYIPDESIIIELFEMDSTKWLKKEHDEKTWLNFYFQIFQSLYTINEKTKYNIGDLKFDNILANQNKKIGKYYIYSIGGIYYKIPISNYFFAIADFGMLQKNNWIIDLTTLSNLEIRKQNIEKSFDKIANKFKKMFPTEYGLLLELTKEKINSGNIDFKFIKNKTNAKNTNNTENYRDKINILFIEQIKEYIVKNDQIYKKLDVNDFYKQQPKNIINLIKSFNYTFDLKSNFPKFFEKYKIKNLLQNNPDFII